MTAEGAILLTLLFAAMAAVGVGLVGWALLFFREAYSCYRADLF